MVGARLPALVLGVLVCVLPAAHGASSSPVAKVIQMLTNMKAKGGKEMADEQAVMDQYAKFVVRRTREVEYEIKTAKASIEELIATITEAEAKVSSTTAQLTKLNAEADQVEAEVKAATELRSTEHADFLEEQTSYTESLYALDRAIQILSSQNMDREQAMALLQKQASTTPGMRRVLAAMALVQVEERSKETQDGAPAVAAYEFQSGGVIEMLKNLQLKFKEELGELEKAEMNSKHANDMQLTHAASILDNLKADITSLTEQKASAAETSASAKGSLAETRASLAEAETVLKDLKATYAAKSSTFAENQKVRAAELEAVDKAVEILSDPSVKDTRSLLQLPGRGLSLLQVRAQSRSTIRGKAASYLQARANALNSKTLAAFAFALKDSPFDKVIGMIEGLIEKLQEEAASEADHKAFCDEELRKNKQKRKTLTSETERLHAEIEEKTMAVAKMGEDIKTLAEEQASLRTAMSDSTAQRQTEKAANEEAIADAIAGSTAVKNAVQVLKEFYSTQGGAFVQQAPEMAEYKGMQSENGGVVAMLEVIQSDFAREEVDTKAAEAQGASEYKQFMEDSEADMKAKHDAEFKLGLQKDEAEFAQGQLEKDLRATSEQLGMADKYYQELKPQCVTVHVSFEERAARRAEEVEALKQAYKILDQKAVA